MHKNIILIGLFFLSAYNLGKNLSHNWNQYEKTGPSDKHSYLVIENKASNSHIGIVKSENGLGAIGIANGGKNPETRIGIQFNENNQHIEYIKISENLGPSGQIRKKHFIIKKVHGKWVLEEAAE